MLTEERLPHARLGEQDRHGPWYQSADRRIERRNTRAHAAGLHALHQREVATAGGLSVVDVLKGRLVCLTINSEESRKLARTRAAENAGDVRPADYFVPGTHSIESVRSRTQPVCILLIVRG